MRIWSLIAGGGLLAGVLLGGALVRWRWARWWRQQAANPWDQRREREWTQAWRGEP